VFRASETPGAAEAELRDSVRDAGIPVFGVVLNDLGLAEMRTLRAPRTAPTPATSDLARPVFAGCE